MHRIPHSIDQKPGKDEFSRYLFAQCKIPSEQMAARKKVFEGSYLADFVVLQPVIEGEAKGGDKVQIFGLNDFLRQTADAVNIITYTKP